MYKPVIVERRRLNEAESIIIVNPQVATTMAEEASARVTNPIFKDFLSRRVRQQLLRDATLHVPVSAPQAQKMFDGEAPPVYIQQAITLFQPMFMIPLTGEAIDKFKQHVQHITDWFNAMEYLLKKEAEPGEEDNQVAMEDKALTQKAISNLPNQTLEQATRSSEAWYARMGKRVRGSKSDVIVLKRWPNGYYGVQYKPNPDGFKAMQSDGNDLQNCLRYGHYEPLMKSGQARVYAIRLPNDEAVVGIALHQNGGVKECKGKNNEAVIDIYAPYAAEFLNALKAKPDNASDLDRAEIEYRNGRFFVFQHDATQIFDHQNVKVWKNDNTALIQISKVFIKVGIDGGKLTLTKRTKIPKMDGSMTTRMMMALGALDMPPDAALAEVLSENCDIHFGGSEFSGGSRYGNFEETSTKVYEQGEVVARKTDNEIRIWNGEQKVGFSLDGGRINNMSPIEEYDTDSDGFDKVVLARVLSTIKMAPTPAGLEMVLENKFGIDYKDGQWGPFNQVAKTLYDRNGYKTWGTDARLYFSHEHITLSASLYGNGISELSFTSEHDEEVPDRATKKTGVTIDSIVGMLNTVKIPPSVKAQFSTTQTIGDKLFEAGIVYTGAEYAPAIEAAEVLYQHANFKLLKSVTVSSLEKPAHNEDDPNDPITSGMREHVIVVDVNNPYRTSRNTWPEPLLDHSLNYAYFTFDKSLIKLMGRSAFVAMANAAKVPYVPNRNGSGDRHSTPRAFGIDIKEGPGKFKRVEEGRKQIIPGLYQLTPKSWVVAVPKGSVIYLVLRDGTLDTDQFVDQDPMLKQVYPRAVQFVAKMHNILNGPENSGVLNPGTYDLGNEGVTATLELLINRIKEMPEAAYLPFIKSAPNLAGLERFFDGLGKLTKKQQQTLYSAVRPRAPWYKIVPDYKTSLYGLTIEREIIRLPAALFLTEFDDGVGISDPALVEKMRSDYEKIVMKVIDLVRDTVPSTLKPPKTYKIFKLEIGHLDFMPAVGIPGQEDLLGAMRELQTAVSDIFAEAERIDDAAIDKGKTYKDYTEEEIMARYKAEEHGQPWHGLGASDTRKDRRVT